MRSWQTFFKFLRDFSGHRYFALSSQVLQAEATRVRSKGYGPTKDLLRGIDTKKQLLVETNLHPADAEMQRRVLSLTSSDVKVYSPLDTEADALKTSGVFNCDGISAISPEQLASVATVIVDQVREQLELSSHVSEAAQDFRAGSVVNAVANCLKEEMERLFVAMQSHEVSFARLLQENSDVICDKIAGVIQSENLQGLRVEEGEETGQLSTFMSKVSTAVTNLESLLKTKLDTTFDAADSSANSMIENIRGHIVEVIEQSSRVQQENLLHALRDTNISSTSRRANDDLVSLEVAQGLVKDAMSQVVDEAKREVQELLTKLREKSTQHSEVVTAEGRDRSSSLEEMLTSYGERLEELRESSARFVDIKELVMELYSQQQSNEVAIHEVRDSVKRLKKELSSAIREVAFSAFSEAASAKGNIDQQAEDRERLNYLAERVTSDVVQQLKKHYSDFDKLPKQISSLEKIILKSQNVESTTFSLLQDADDSRLLALAQSISDSILASLPQSEESKKPSFTKFEIAETVSEILRPKFDELAAAVMEKATETVQRLEDLSENAGEKSHTFLDEQQLVTLAQTIAECVRDAVQKQTLSEQNNNNNFSGEDVARVVTEHLDDLKKTILINIKEEMERTHEVDITPFQAYIDDVLGGLKDVLCERQAATQASTDSLAATLLERLEEQQALLQEVRAIQENSENVAADSNAKAEAFAAENMTKLSENIIKEVRKIATEESAAVLSSIDAVQNEVLSATEKLPLAVEESLSKLETSISEAQKAEKNRSDSLQTTLQDMHTCIVSANEESSSAKQLLESINNTVSDLAQQNATSVSDMKSQLTEFEGRTAALHAQTITDLSQHFVKLQEELQNGKGQLEELVSSSAEYKNVASSVETMQVKLMEATSFLDGINTLLATHVSGQSSACIVGEEEVSARLDKLSVTTNDILLELREYCSAQKSEKTDVRHMDSTLEEIENRLTEQLRNLHEKFDKVVPVDSVDVAPAVDDVAPLQNQQVDVTTRGVIDEIDALIKVLHGSRSAQEKQIKDRLNTLRLLVIEAGLCKAERGNMEGFLQILEENQLKLKEDITNAETILVEEVNTKVQKALEKTLTSINENIASSTDSLFQKLQYGVDNNGNEIISEQKHVALELKDRLNKLETTLEACVTGMKDGIQKGIAEEIHHVVQQATVQDISRNVKSAVEELCTTHIQSLQNCVDEYGSQGRLNATQLLSKVKQVSDDISHISGFAGEMRAAMNDSSMGVIKEVRRTQETLSESLEQHLSALREQLPVFMTAPLSPDTYKYTHKDTATSSVKTLHSLSLWWLLLLSLVIVASIMACAYFIFAAFLVAFVPLPPQTTSSEGDSLADVDSPFLKRQSFTRVVDQVML